MTQDDSEYRQRIVQDAETAVSNHDRYPSRDTAGSAVHALRKLLRRGFLTDASRRVQQAARGF